MTKETHFTISKSIYTIIIMIFAVYFGFSKDVALESVMYSIASGVFFSVVWLVYIKFVIKVL